MTVIPLIDTPRQRLTVVVFGLRVTMTIYWQPISLAWYFDCDMNNQAVIRGRRIALDVNLTEYVQNDDYIGGIYCRSLTDGDDDPGLNAWGKTHQLVHDAA